MTSKIEWTEFTWNPVTGCTKVSPGCKNCYAENMAKRLQAMNARGYENGFDLTLLQDRIDLPLKRKKPTVYFVCSMSDLFHERVPDSFIGQVMQTIEQATQHRFQILTKRAERMATFFKSRAVPSNVWLGVTVEDKRYGLPRIDFLRQVPAKLRFLSIEPLLEDLSEINLENIEWVIVGGESGVKARRMQKEWVENIRQQCLTQKVAFFFKQWGTWGADGVKRSKKENGKLLEGVIQQEMPVNF